jgi:predicted TIM-barrel fold metal-dependent hydrolase
MYYRLLASALVYFKPIIDAHPTRLMWGTDLIYSWNYEADTMHELVRFGRDFIAGLDPEPQERFAYKNAVEMLGLSVSKGD